MADGFSVPVFSLGGLDDHVALDGLLAMRPGAAVASVGCGGGSGSLATTMVGSSELCTPFPVRSILVRSVSGGR